MKYRIVISARNSESYVLEHIFQTKRTLIDAQYVAEAYVKDGFWARDGTLFIFPRDIERVEIREVT